jgi:hypothetical protein
MEDEREGAGERFRYRTQLEKQRDNEGETDRLTDKQIESEVQRQREGVRGIHRERLPSE